MLIKILMCIKIQFIFNNLNQSPIKKRNFFYYINLSRCKIVKKITYSYVHIKMKHFLSPSKPVEPLIKSLNPHSPVLNVKNILHSLFHRQKRKKKSHENFPSHCTLRLFVTCWRFSSLLHKFASLTLVKAGERDSRARNEQTSSILSYNYES